MNKIETIIEKANNNSLVSYLASLMLEYAYTKDENMMFPYLKIKELYFRIKDIDVNSLSLKNRKLCEALKHIIEELDTSEATLNSMTKAINEKKETKYKLYYAGFMRAYTKDLIGIYLDFHYKKDKNKQLVLKSF